MHSGCCGMIDSSCKLRSCTLGATVVEGGGRVAHSVGARGLECGECIWHDREMLRCAGAVP